ncbi:4-alpha-glucanotransferase [Desulfocurvus sp.]|uniref:4-alpha-glucanotransferase n=1 Tax=Desulfocurvus sp. TaxID=2871698 RepID=UPI0025C1C23C|nr:4-alpha-glucanotransferase [Desulfocurvus sp.]MCK9240071.1 4-alpha-glucanotransferase [Desulfocurvus sp.]
MAAAPRPRASGVLLHVTSLPAAYGVGDMGSAAREFVDFLHAAGQRWWQILPLNPTATVMGNSPYSSPSLFAGNPLLISPEALAAEGWLRLADLGGLPGPAPAAGGRADFAAAQAHREALLGLAFERARPRLAAHEGFARFVAAHGPAWLDDYACFTVLKARQGGAPWNAWPEPLRRRDPAALAALRRDAAPELDAVRFSQYLFFSQWAALRRHCAARGVGIIGDLPFYPCLDSADVWAHPGCFRLDADLQPTVVAGVPPDYFSADGQLWGNPVYDWQAQAADGYSWWLSRLGHNLAWADLVRLDHFRALAAYWAVPPGAATAREGRWEPGPGEGFLRAARARFPGLPLLAEDLGLITDDVLALRDAFGLPGMRVLQFGLGPDAPDSANALHNHSRASVVYTGTHDNNTTRGWFDDELGPGGRAALADYLGRLPEADEAAWTLIRLALLSPAHLAVIPAQDLLGLGSGARMNTPSVPAGNWAWRLGARDLTPALAQKLRHLCRLYGRT